MVCTHSQLYYEFEKNKISAHQWRTEMYNELELIFISNATDKSNSYHILSAIKRISEDDK